jgi:trk system potassium uptake protein TrkH
MINFRIIARVFSQVLIFEGAFMLLAAAVSWIYKEPAAGSFLYSAIITLVTGILVFTPLRHEEKVYGTREGYIINTCIWLLFSIFGALPYLFSSTAHNFTDAFFESISGFTTTAASVFRNVESLPHGILFWRSLTQWIGGIVIITLSFYVLPVVRSVNIQISTTEFSGHLTDKIHPKVIETTKRLISIYVFLTLGEALLLIIGKMPVFDAICHSLSTLSTGGFSTKANGIAAFPSPFIRAVITIFMFLAGMNPALIYFAIKRNFNKIFHNNEFILYVILVAAFSLIIGLLLSFNSGAGTFRSISDGFFHTVSIITTTGFYTENFGLWSHLLVILIFILMFSGGMAGSASGGIKVIRLLIVAQNSRNESKRLIHPYAYLPIQINKKNVPSNIVYNLLIFIILYFITICAGTLVISLMDYDIITSFSTTASMVANIGPGLGTFSPFTTYAEMPTVGKWVLSGLMLLGRLELLTVIILFTRSFYKR